MYLRLRGRATYPEPVLVEYVAGDRHAGDARDDQNGDEPSQLRHVVSCTTSPAEMLVTSCRMQTQNRPQRSISSPCNSAFTYADVLSSYVELAALAPALVVAPRVLALAVGAGARQPLLALVQI
jgi:hypothetical protein